ncbi:DNA-binding response regulator, NarL/FixJ family, contains REC and HTH domains [Arthrobacter alpinus]|uniref:DNA-binding response regulator, NarL/FixJ family, contains REC and HTH domains n=1 Tax=Arthrobacter alpinus TaxID=656366 RepID=A0A1H5N190_9MICC|nr:response regulator transcription factor [Arthrobacter alpinus]SEE94418.1 DNA-binding response regulator, NarL/FixJ family, contains REC and HTH domains [Arthrobacter alpinus]
MRVVLAEDSVLLREGLVRLLEETGAVVCAAVGDGTELLAAVQEHVPDLLITDVRMPPSHRDEGLKAALDVRARFPSVAILVLSQYVELSYASELLAGASNGAGLGYLLKDRVARFEDFADAIRRVTAGATVIDPEVVSTLLTNRTATDPLNTLSPRESQVLGLMAQGLTNAGIAKTLVISAGAVEKHISAIFIKLGLQPGADDHRRVLAVLSFLQHGG